MPYATESGGTSLLLGLALVIEWIGFELVPMLIRKALVASAHGVVGNQGLEAVRFERLEVGFAVIAGIGRDGGVLR